MTDSTCSSRVPCFGRTPTTPAIKTSAVPVQVAATLAVMHLLVSLNGATATITMTLTATASSLATATKVNRAGYVAAVVLTGLLVVVLDGVA